MFDERYEQYLSIGLSIIISNSNSDTEIVAGYLKITDLKEYG